MNRLIEFFLPKETKFFHMWARQSGLAFAASKEFHSFVKGYNSFSEQQRGRAIRKIGKLESLADVQTQAVIDLLHKSLVTPYDREDVHELTILLDDVLDYIDDAARKLVLFRIKSVPPVMVKQSALISGQVKLIDEAINSMQEHKALLDYCDKIYELEHRGDVLYEDSISSLFNGEGKNAKSANEIIKFKDIYEGLEKIFDKGKDVADTMRTIVVKHG